MSPIIYRKEDSLNCSRSAAQRLLSRLLAALGPVTLDIMVDYLRLPPVILLADVQLLQSIATLLPQLSGRITQTLTESIQDLVSGKECAFEHAAVLNALNAFPLDGKLSLVTPERDRVSHQIPSWQGEHNDSPCGVSTRRRISRP